MDEEAATRRAAYVRGLREVADFLDAHPELPTPWGGVQANVFVDTKAELAAVARTGHLRWEKIANGEYFYLRATFSGEHSYDINVNREQVCRKVVTGVRLEPARPACEVEEYEWVCDEPLLAESGTT